MTKFLYFIILLGCINIVAAQQDIVYLNRVTTQEGLSETTNWFLHPNQEGLIFIGSLDGLNIYDGISMNVYKAGNGQLSIIGSAVQSPFFETDAGDILFTTDEAINIFQKSSGRIIAKKLRAVKGAQIYNALHLEDDKFLWVTTQGKLYRCGITDENQMVEKELLSSFRGVRGCVFYDSISKTSILLSSFWQREFGMELIRFDQNNTLVERDTLFSILKHDELPSLLVFDVLPGSGNIGWAHALEGLLKIDINHPRTNYKIFLSPVVDVPISSVTSISEKLLGVLLKNGELFFFDKEKEIFSASGIVFHDLNTKRQIQRLDHVFIGQDSIIWFSTDEEGVYYGHLSNSKFKSLLSYNGIEQEDVEFLYEDPKGSIHGFSKKSCFSFINEATLLAYEGAFPFSKAINDNEGLTWGIKGNTLFSGKMEDQGDWSLHVLDSVSRIYDIINYNTSFLLLAAVEGIFFYDKKNKKLLRTPYLDRTVKLFLQGKNQLWSANAAGSLQVWQLEGKTIPTLNSIAVFENSGMINDITFDVDRDVIWVATIKGLLSINSKTFASTLITEKNGLNNQNIQSIIVDTTGVLWLSTNQGIIRYQPEQSGPAAFRQYTARDGLSSNEYEPGAALLASNGSVWFGSTKGVDVFNPYALHDVGRAPRLVLKNLKIHDQPWDKNSTSCSLENLELTYLQNTLAFELTALEYTDPSRNQFKVQLEYEGNADTTFLGTQNRITYANLSPGNYVFRFTACNAEGIWQEEWYELPIVIHPPFTQTWWFRLLVVLGLMALVGFILTFYYRYQLHEQQLESERQERKAERERLQLETSLNLEQERTRIASDFHDEIGGGLSTIRNASAVAARKEEVEDIRSVLQRVSEISQSLIVNMRTIIWAMDPGFDSLDDLGTYIRGYTKEFLNDNGLASQLHIPIDLPKIGLNGKARHNLLMVVKEALHNIVKHAEATEVDFRLEISEQLLITIIDNGKGFDPENLKRRGSGLKNMKKRIEAIGGKINWEPNPTKGTRVVIQYAIIATA